MRVRETGSACRISCCMSVGTRFQQTCKIIVGMPIMELPHWKTWNCRLSERPTSKQQVGVVKGQLMPSLLCSTHPVRTTPHSHTCLHAHAHKLKTQLKDKQKCFKSNLVINWNARGESHLKYSNMDPVQQWMECVESSFALVDGERSHWFGFGSW